MKRREVIAGVAVVAAGGVIPAVVGYQGASTGTGDAPPASDLVGEVHTERYQGRTIRVAEHGTSPVVTIDGRELHLMRWARAPI
jgi:hypothetical protein